MTATTRLPDRVRPADRPVPVPEPPVFRRDVQGLRALAVLLLVGWHVGVAGLSGGAVGLDLFFVISGFVLTAGAFRELRLNGRLSLRRFYARRTTRLVPAATLVVLGSLAAAWHWMPPADRAPVSADAVAAATATMNVRLAMQDSVPVDVSPLQHFWPLSLLVQFCLVWPVLLIVVALAWARRGRPSVLSAALLLTVLSAASLALWLEAAANPWTVYGLPARFWEFGAGALIALGAQRLAGLPAPLAAALTWLGLGTVAAAVASGDPLVAVLGAGLTIAGGCARPSWGARRLLRLKPVQELGRVSFSWYLWHWPILVLAPHVLGRPLTTPIEVALVVAALVPAAMSVAAVENRIHLHRGLRLRPGRALALGGALTAATAGLALAVPHLPTARTTGPAAALAPAEVLASGRVTVPQLQRIIRDSVTTTVLPRDLTPALARASANAPRDGGCLVPAASRFVSDNIGRGCERHGDVTGRRIMVLFGDSHAQQWFPAVDTIARNRGWRLAVFTKADCGPALGQVDKAGSTVPYAECDQWRLRALNRIRQLRPAMVVMSARNRVAGPLNVEASAGPDQDWASAWAATVTRIKRAGALPVVIPDTPVTDFDVPRCLATRPDAVHKCHLDVFRSLFLPRQRIVRALVQAHGGRVVNSTAWFCTPTICPAVIGGTVVYRDDNHLTSAYAKQLAGVLDEALAE
ncbi:acyltransferase family protein [Actinoplanes auranticolor]|uniref:Acyltransferase n=1 Tax=Actinoplanes auranticolor TaxID=47988 RepID=A0A919VUH0_9ACTN|nr:acyltransferase family protein [Actinoplanes auranticolor]GIM79389.1 acyltransferase [Actinoplanes auranticolor]